jgi:hypothetical protein
VILSHHVLIDGLFAIQVYKPFHYFWAQQILISCEGHSFLVQTRECVGTAIGSSLVVGLTEISRKTALLLFNVDVSPIVHAMS